MQSIDDRIRSFAPITKPKSAARPGWPLPAKTHPKLTARRLADAGFYFAPTPEGPDTCKCYSCGLALGGWDEGDDPVDEHWQRREGCAWAEFMCAMRRERRDEIYPYVTSVPPMVAAWHRAHIQRLGVQRESLASVIRVNAHTSQDVRRGRRVVAAQGSAGMGTDREECEWSERGTCKQV